MNTTLAQVAYRASTDHDFRIRIEADPEGALAPYGLSAADTESRAMLLALSQSAPVQPAPAPEKPDAATPNSGWFGGDSPIGMGLTRSTLDGGPGVSTAAVAYEGWFGGESPLPSALKGA